jgi:hypothetical protein
VVHDFVSSLPLITTSLTSPKRNEHKKRKTDPKSSNKHTAAADRGDGGRGRLQEGHIYRVVCCDGGFSARVPFFGSILRKFFWPNKAVSLGQICWPNTVSCANFLAQQS